jgi:hypothetical protein
MSVVIIAWCKLRSSRSQSAIDADQFKSRQKARHANGEDDEPKLPAFAVCILVTLCGSSKAVLGLEGFVRHRPANRVTVDSTKEGG